MKVLSSFRIGMSAAIALIAIAVGVCIPVRAQIEKTLRFEPNELDFGIIREEEGKVKRSVKAINISPDTTFIISARTSCGCSAVEYPETLLAPGDSTEISVTYDPLNRPGRFLKTTKVFTGEERIGNSFKLKGLVVPGNSSLELAYPEKAGDLRLTTSLLNVGQISASESRPLFVGIYNGGPRGATLTVETDAAPLEGAVAPDSIETFGIGTLSLMLRGKEIKGAGREFVYHAYIIDRQTGDTITTIPVGGVLRLAAAK